jgi:hypothetical protein
MSIEKIRWIGVTGLTVFLLGRALSADAADLPPPPADLAMATSPPEAESVAAEHEHEATTFYLSASLNEGLSSLSGTGTSSSGTQTELMMVGSLVFSNWIIEGGGGWFLSSLSSNQAASAPSQSTGLTLESDSLSTAGGVAEISPQYRLTDHLQIGPLAEMLFGTDVSFGGIGSSMQDMAWLGGAQALYEFRLGGTSLKLGARYLASLSLSGETLQAAEATLQFGLPIF